MPDSHTTKTFNADDIKFAAKEALKRYPQASSGIAFLIGALGFQSMDVTEEDRQWARETFMGTNQPHMTIPNPRNRRV